MAKNKSLQLNIVNLFTIKNKQNNTATNSRIKGENLIHKRENLIHKKTLKIGFLILFIH
jgi:hypothetical protein